MTQHERTPLDAPLARGIRHAPLRVTPDWQPVPEGYALPGISPPVHPLCSHCVNTPRGWSADCPRRATLTREIDGRRAWACAVHRDDITPEMV